MLTLEQGWDLARAWYSEDRRDPDWRRKTLDEVKGMFQEIGMVEPFWSLTG